MKKKFVSRNQPEYSFMLAFNTELVEKYKSKLSIIERAINENWTINRLIDEFGEEFAVSLGINSSGVDVAKLDSMEVEEWTWQNGIR